MAAFRNEKRLMVQRVFKLSTVALLTLLFSGAAAAQQAAAANTVTIQVFSDFQCPFCAQFATTIRSMQKTQLRGVSIVIEFKHFPLSFHPDAMLAAQASLAAKEQGKFWEMHDLLFANQMSLQRSSLLRFAQELKLDFVRFRQDLDSERLKMLIENDVTEGTKLGVNATPSFLVNGKPYSGAKSYEQLKQLVENEVRRMQALAEVSDKLLAYGPADAPVTLEVFVDLQSPISRQAFAVLDQVNSKYAGKVRVQFRNFPLAFHPQARLAHEAAMTAAAQGRFWDFARYILERQDSLREQDLIAYAGKLGLDEIKFADVVAQHRYAPRVDFDLTMGRTRGVRGSPVIFVGGKRIDGVPSLQILNSYIDAELVSEIAKPRHTQSQ
jgi:protein-disulfide isomerase